MTSIETLRQLYLSLFGKEPNSVEQLSQSGSNRHYFRLKGDNDIIGVEGTSLKENTAFIYFSHHFISKGLPVPKVLAVSRDKMSYIQEDLGNKTLFEEIQEGRITGRFSANEKYLLSKAICLLPKIQIEGFNGLDLTKCYQSACFDRRSIMWDLNYFKYSFLKGIDIDFDENALENDFESLACCLLSDKDPQGFMYRDFQSRNIMIRDGNPWLIDFQGGRKGPIYYDLASFLWQAKANFPQDLRDEMISIYLSELKKYIEVDESFFKTRLKIFVLFRLLQVLGAYGYRGYFQKKRHFIESIPLALENLKTLLVEPFEECSYLCSLLNNVVLSRDKKNCSSETFTVTVESFSYKKGIPDDASGNGGGFVFDCRAINNPGKYDEYKSLTGLDKPVIDFLEKDGEILIFIEKCVSLIKDSIAKYRGRGFKDLMVCFGCTGGQHRSVYSAQKVAQILNEKYKVKVNLIHRERGINQVLDIDK